MDCDRSLPDSPEGTPETVNAWMRSMRSVEADLSVTDMQAGHPGAWLHTCKSHAGACTAPCKLPLPVRKRWLSTGQQLAGGAVHRLRHVGFSRSGDLCVCFRVRFGHHPGPWLPKWACNSIDGHISWLPFCRQQLVGQCL